MTSDQPWIDGTTAGADAEHADEPGEVIATALADAAADPADAVPADAPREAPDEVPDEVPDDASDDASDGGAEVAPRAVDAPPAPDEAELPARLEALLFVSDGAIEESALGRALGVNRRRLDRGLDALADQLREGGRGVRLQRGPEGAQLVTAPESSAHVEYFLGLEAARRLSTAALETLAIVAYRQPVTRGTIETIRGVSSDAAVATLRARGLIADGGRAEGPGRPVLWVTTQRFLHHFGLERPSDLPPLPADIELPDEDAGAQLELAVPDGGDATANDPGETGDPGDPGETGEPGDLVEAIPDVAEDATASPPVDETVPSAQAAQADDAEPAVETDVDAPGAEREPGS